MEREPQPQPPIVKFTEAAKAYASKEAENSPQFKMAVAEIRKQLGGDGNKESKDVAENMIKQGIGMISAKIGMLPVFFNPESRPQIIEKLKKDKVKGAWIEILNNWDVQADPYGQEVLEACKQKDIEQILAQAKEEKDPNKKKQIEIHAQAIAIGEDLIINYYLSQAGGVAEQLAA